MTDLLRPAAGRRAFLTAAAATVPLALGGWRAVAAPATLKGDELPLHTEGLEHISMAVPDVTPVAKFNSAVYGHGLFREVDPPLRYYVMLGQAYIAIGSRAGLAAPTMDHYCVTVDHHNRDLMNAAVEARGIKTGMRGLVPDPDKIGLQMLEYPAGLVDTNVPADRLLGRGYGLVVPIKLDHVLLRVTDMARSTKFYDVFLTRTKARENGQIWYKAGDTTIRLAPQIAGKAGAFERYGVRVGPYDDAKVATGLLGLGAKVDPRSAKGHLRFTDPSGFQAELIAV